MFKQRILAAVSAVTLLSGAAAHADEAASYAQGFADWQTFKPWFDAQAGDRAAGVRYWAANRNVPNHQSCTDAGSDFKMFGDKLTFTVGCQEAERRLDPIDARRRSDPEYRLGFADAAKGLSPQANAPVPSAQALAPQANAPVPSGQAPVASHAADEASDHGEELPSAPKTPQKPNARTDTDTGCGFGGKDPCHVIAAATPSAPVITGAAPAPASSPPQKFDYHDTTGGAAPTTSRVPDEAAASAAAERVCAQKKQADATWQQINNDQDSGTELTRDAKQPDIEARREQVDIDFAAKVNPLLAQGFPLKLNSAKVEPNEINYRHGLELGFSNDCGWSAKATIVPTDTAKQLLATVPPGTTLFVSAQLDTYERQYLFNQADLNVTKITLPDGRSLATEPVIRTANEAKIDDRYGETFIYCQARGGGMFECARIAREGRSDPL